MKTTRTDHRSPITDHSPAPPRSILILKPSSLGDIIHTLPAVACIKKHWPSARLTWLVNPEWAPLLASNPYISDHIEFPRARFRGIRGLFAFPGWCRALRERAAPDLVLDFQGLLRSGLIARAMKVPTWGLSDCREGAQLFHHRRIPVPPRGQPPHAVERNLALAAALGADTTSALEWPLPSAPLPERLPNGYILIHPFSRGRGKSLTVEEVGAFCRAVAPCPVVLAGRSEENVPPLPNLHDLLNRTTLPELCALIRAARSTVSVDSGPMHLAAALGGPLLAIHTWSDPRLVGPWNPRAMVWKAGTLSRMSSYPTGEPVPRHQLGNWLARMLQNPPPPTPN